jgi:RHS repeat-associated protein
MVDRMQLEIIENSEIVSAQDYYPYGEILRQYTYGSGVNDKYKFTEKERDTETNYDYFGARFYDSELARWLQVDPLWEKYHGWSSYNYTLNNPLRFIDPDGKEVDNILNEMLGDDGKFFAEKPKPQKAQKSQKTKSNSKSPTPTILISLDAALAALFGYNGSVGVAFNPGQSQMYGFVRHGMSGGVFSSRGISIKVVDQPIEETRASGRGLIIAPEKNTTELQGGFNIFGGSIIFDSQENGKELIGGSFQVGKGYGGFVVNETFQSYETKTININFNDGQKSINQLNMKPLKYYK